jgi:hypothetical protein
MKKIVALTMILLSLTGCATSGSQSQDEAFKAASPLFNGQGYVLIWAPGANNQISESLASAFIGDVGLDSPIVLSIYKTIAPASDTDVRVAISGPDSMFAAKSAISALNETTHLLPKLQLAFIGQASDAEQVRSAVESKGGKFLFSTPTGS